MNFEVLLSSPFMFLMINTFSHWLACLLLTQLSFLSFVIIFTLAFCHINIISLASYACYLHDTPFPILVLTAYIYFLCVNYTSCDRIYLGLDF